MTKNEALKLALEALEGYESCIDGYYADAVCPQIDKAITAIKEALAQPEQDGQCKRCTDGCPACDARKLPEQEPVACKECHLKDAVYDLLGDLKVANLKLSILAKRTLIGLTDEEREQVINANTSTGLWHMAKDIEAKLKEKNT